MSSYAISGRGKECIWTFIALVSAMWGPQANVLHSAVRISSWLFLNFRFMLMSIFNSTVQSVPCHSNNMPQATQGRHSNHDHRVSNWLMQCKRIRCRVCTAKNKQKEINSSVKNATQGCVLPQVSRYITPNCISEGLLTLKWKGRTHKCT